MDTIRNRLRPTLFYGWWVVIIGFTVATFGEGAYGYLLRNHPRLTMEELGGSGAELVLTIWVISLAGVLPLLAAGPFIDRFGARWPMVAGVALVSVGFLALSTVLNTFMVFILSVSFIAVGRSAGFLLPAQTAAANWLVRRRSLALALVSAASIGGATLTLIMGSLPWRGTFFGLGVGLIAIGIPLALMMRHRPEQHVQPPVLPQAPREGNGSPPEGANLPGQEVNFTLGQTLRTRAFWLLALAMFLTQESVTVASTYQGHLLLQRGLTLSALRTATEFVPLIGILLFGYLGDRFSKSHLLALTATLQIISPALVMVPGHMAPVLLYPLVFGLGSGTVPLLLAIRADYFGRRAFATITVATILITSLLGRLALLLLGVLAISLQIATGSNLVMGLVLPILIGLPAPVLFFFVRGPRPRQPVACVSPFRDKAAANGGHPGR